MLVDDAGDDVALELGNGNQASAPFRCDAVDWAFAL